jgi:hypothetical protein
MTAAPPIVQVRFVDLATQTNVHPGLSATLKDMRTKIRITLRQLPSDSSDIQNALVTIARKDGTDKAKQYELSIGQNDITYSSIEGDMKYPFDINVTYSIRIIAELSKNGSSSVVVAEFTYGDNENEPSYDNFIYRDPENLDEFNNGPGQFKLVDHEMAEEDGTIKISCPIEFKETTADPRKPVSVSFIFDEVDDYAGTANDTTNSEHKKAYINLPYQNSGIYEIIETNLTGELENDRAHHIAVTARYADGHAIKKTLDDILHMIVNPAITVDPYGLGTLGAGDLATASVAVLYVEKATIGGSGSRIPANDEFTVNFSQGTTIMYTGTLKVSEGTEMTHGGKTVLMYDITLNQLDQPGTPSPNTEGKFDFDAQIIVDYTTLPGTVVPTLEKPSNIVTGTYINDYTPLTDVYVANAWMAATNVDVSGNRVVDMTNATTASGYTNAPDIGIVGYFYKTAHFGSGASSGLLQDLDVVGTKFKYEISVTSGTEPDNWVAVEKIHQIQGTSGKTHQQNYIDVINEDDEDEDENIDGEYANIPYSTTPRTIGPSQPAIYFRIPAFSSSEGKKVKVRVTIVPASTSTNVGSKESNGKVPVVVVKKISRYTMTVETDSEPKFTGSGANGILAVPINAEGAGADLTFVSAQFESNLAAPNANITQTDTDADNVYDLIVTNPSKRGADSPQAITYTVTYKINDPTTTTAGTVSIKSVGYTINVTDDPTSENFTVTDYDYKTFNDDGESSFTFKISFTNGTTSSIKGVNVYFFNSDVSGNILVKNVPRGNVMDNVSTEYTVTLQDSAANSSAASDGILIDLTGGTNSSNKWLNYRSGKIFFVPYDTPRVSPRFVSFTPTVRNHDDKIEQDSAKTEKLILNIPVIDMPKNVLLVGGVVESYSGTQLKWSDDRDDYPQGVSVGPSYDLVVNDVNESNDVVADSADSSKRSYSVDTDSNPAPYNFTIVLRTKLASTVDSTVYYSKPVNVEFTSASVDLSNATAVVRRGSNVTTLKAQLNGYATIDASDIQFIGVTVFVEPNFVAPSSGWSNPSYIFIPGNWNDSTLESLGLNDNIKSIRIPDGFTVKVWRNAMDVNSEPAATYTSDTAQTITSISYLRVEGSYTSRPSNLNVTELKLVDRGENVCIALQNGVETVLTDAQIGKTEGGIISDSSRSIITHDPDVDGWSIKNTYADGATRPKVNLYYYGNVNVTNATPPSANGSGLDANNSFTLSQATGLGLYAVFNQNQGAKEYPFFNAYTARTSESNNKSWYKSKVFYGSDSSGDTTADSDKAGLTLVFTGTDDGSLFPEITRRVKYVVKVGPNLTNANVGYESEPVWLLSLQTSGADTSSSESFNFRLLETGMFTGHNSFGQLNLRFNVVSADPESAAVNELTCSSTDAAIQAVGTTIHTYDLSTDYVKSDTLQLLARMEAGVDYTEKRGDDDAEDQDSEPTYLSLVPTARVAYACASKPSVEVVGTRGTYENRKVINLKINANGLEREGVQSVILSLLKEGDHTVDGASEGSEIVLSFESSNARLRSYLVEENGATNTVTGSSDNLGPLEHHELLENDVDGFSGTALINTNTFLLVMGTLDDNDESKLHLPVGSEWDDGDVTVLAVVSTRIGTDIDYDTVVDPVEPTLSNFSIGSISDSVNIYVGSEHTIQPPTTNSDGSFSYTSSDETVATISGNHITMVGVGQTTITATQAASTLFLSGQISFIVQNWRHN